MTKVLLVRHAQPIMDGETPRAEWTRQTRAGTTHSLWEDVEGALRDLEMQRAMVAESRELVEKKVREIQALLVAQYQKGTTDPDD